MSPQRDSSDLSQSSAGETCPETCGGLLGQADRWLIGRWKEEIRLSGLFVPRQWRGKH